MPQQVQVLPSYSLLQSPLLPVCFPRLLLLGLLRRELKELPSCFLRMLQMIPKMQFQSLLWVHQWVFPKQQLQVLELEQPEPPSCYLQRPQGLPSRLPSLALHHLIPNRPHQNSNLRPSLT